MNLTTRPSIESFFFRNGWVLFFGLTVLGWYLYSVNTLDNQSLALVHQQLDLLQQREKALMQKEDLLLRINSQSDPAWVELTLMKGLGLVPEEQTKVFFSKEAH